MSAPAQQIEQRETVTFVWTYGRFVIGSFDVPIGFNAKTENYREGIVTRLCYSDGSCFLFQRGWKYRIPLFQNREHVVDSSRETTDRTIRRGHYKQKSDVWGEDDYKPRTYHPPLNGIIEAIMPNLGYEHVPARRQAEFAKALESFKPSQK